MRDTVAAIDHEKEVEKQQKDQARNEKAILRQEEQLAKEQRAKDRAVNKENKVLSKAAAALRQLHQKEAAQSSKQLQLDIQQSTRKNTTSINTSITNNPSPLASRSKKTAKLGEEADRKTTRSGRVVRPTIRSLS